MRSKFMALVCMLSAGVLVAAACTATPQAPINTPPTAVILAAPTSGAPPLLVDFSGVLSTDAGGSIVAYDWDLGDGNTSTLDQFQHTYTAEGIYTVTLTVTDNKGATDTETTDITVAIPNVPPTAVAAADVTTGIAPMVVNFTSSAADSDGTVVSIDWDFGDGGTSTDADPTHTYTTTGVYSATVSVTDDEAAVTADSVTITVNGNQAPTAVATSDVTAGKTPLAVTFDGSTSSDPDNAIASYAWDFGDGNSDTGATPAAHTYLAAGSYTATLTVTDVLGATDTDTVNITVTDNVAPLASASGTPTAGDFPLAVTFDGTASSDSDGTIVSYSWNYGDGNSDTGATPAAHTYTAAGSYNAVLTVTDDNGAIGTDTVTISVDTPNVAPTASFTQNTTSGPEDLVVNFDGSGSTDSDGTVVGYAWDFGDGGSANGATPTHTYLTPGTFTASLTVTDNDGATDSTSVQITVAANQAPTAVAAGSPLTGKEDLTVSFDSTTGSSDPDGTIVSTDWDFGDGNTSTSADPSHTYVDAGSYTATLTVTDEDGATDTDTVSITVTPNTPPTAAISANPTNGARPLVVAFDSTSGSSDPDGTIVSTDWDFGDGNSSTSADPSHTYAVGSYTATLTVTDDSGDTDVDTVGITVVIDDDADGVSPPTDCDDNAPLTYPGAADTLDAAGVDSNCDGADGIASDTLFVSTTGTDSGSCGAEGSECATIGQALTNASGSGKGVVQVTAGSFGGFTLSGDIVVRGGYASDFDTRSGTTTVTGSGTGVLASGATAGAALADLTINSGSPSGAGASAYGVRATGSTLEVRDSVVLAAAGNAGSSGGSAPGAGANGCNGSNGGNATGPSSPGGGASGCGGTSPSNPGSGGTGGNYSGSGQAGGSGGGGASGGNGGCGSLFGCGTNAGGGAAGAKGAAGSAGSGGSNSAASAGSTYVGLSGSAGTGGARGGGGGGGGGGKSASASGGGGGAGGGGGTGGAGGTNAGSAGGGSFGVYSYNSTVTLTTVDATAGTGGAGGAGQPGAKGGNGGNGGGGGNDSCCSAGGGGGGGAGGAAGAGGGAGGGAAGPSIAVFNTGSGSLVLSGNTLSKAATAASGGSGGAGGAAGSGGSGGSGNDGSGGGGTASAGNAGPSGSAGASGLRLSVWDNGTTTP